MGDPPKSLQELEEAKKNAQDLKDAAAKAKEKAAAEQAKADALKQKAKDLQDQANAKQAEADALKKKSKDLQDQADAKQAEAAKATDPAEQARLQREADSLQTQSNNAATNGQAQQDAANKKAAESKDAATDGQAQQDAANKKATESSEANTKADDAQKSFDQKDVHPESTPGVAPASTPPPSSSTPLGDPYDSAMRGASGLLFSPPDLKMGAFPYPTGPGGKVDAPKDKNGKELPPLPDAANGTAYPPMADSGNPPDGFEITTVGSEYKWVGGDSSRITVGDKREIVGATSTLHVNSTRHTTIAGANFTNYMAGNYSYTKTMQKNVVDGDQVRETKGNQFNTILGNRYVKNFGSRTEINLGPRTEKWFSGRNEMGFGVRTEWVGGTKFETIGGIKHTSVLGAKIDHVKGAKIEVSNGPASYKSPNVFYAVAGAITFCKFSKLVQKGGKVETKADKVNVDAETEIKKKMTVKDDVKMTRRAFITGKFSASGGDLKAG